MLWCGLEVSTVSNLNSSCIELELGFGFDNTRTFLEILESHIKRAVFSLGYIRFFFQLEDIPVFEC